jgi:hypothetical protein
MNNFGLRVSIRFLVYFQIFVDAFRLVFIRVLVKVANELEDISLGIDEIIDEKVFGYTEEDYWFRSLDEDSSDA